MHPLVVISSLETRAHILNDCSWFNYKKSDWMVIKFLFLTDNPGSQHHVVNFLMRITRGYHVLGSILLKQRSLDLVNTYLETRNTGFEIVTIIMEFSSVAPLFLSYPDQLRVIWFQVTLCSCNTADCDRTPR